MVRALNDRSENFDLSNLTNQQLQIIAEIVNAFKVPVKSTTYPELGLGSGRFFSDFQSRLVLYHAINEDAMKKKAFEFAFAKSCNADGRNAIVAESPVVAAADVTVDNQRFSCKTEAPAKMNVKLINISKLMEARWIRECRSGTDFCDGIKNNVVSHLLRYERIIMLRAFRRGEFYDYRLIEIPLRLLLLVDGVQPKDFSSRTKNGSTSAPVRLPDGSSFLLRLDGSVEKVTVTRLPERMCSIHGTWSIPIRLNQSILSLL